ncbi:hypothetical protein TNIN_243461 [Trichonephila inaurata madagascariensis]|uniref:Uncharacterized protein n=1 Tax=Trichonephila inaurata madagascariensis TaxID=2747483 RepID=A0A8X6XZ93_9ARAC|nr:hypothetical protein TNIN_243461 [Trichonephila inaurata madagascariensis]
MGNEGGPGDWGNNFETFPRGPTFRRLKRGLDTGNETLSRVRGHRNEQHKGGIEKQPETSTWTVFAAANFVPHDGLASDGSRRPSTHSCAACARLESNQAPETCRFLKMLPPTIGCAIRLFHTRAIHR